MTVSLIVAIAQDHAIGKDNTIPWHLPEDMRYFRNTTKGKTVIMGRKTWESLPEAFRPLPGRQNIVISRNAAYEAQGATVKTSLTGALEAAGQKNPQEVFVIGGAEIYRDALPLADRLYATLVAMKIEGADAFFPKIDPADWEEISRQKGEGTSPVYDFVIYQRIKN